MLPVAILSFDAQYRKPFLYLSAKTANFRELARQRTLPNDRALGKFRGGLIEGESIREVQDDTDGLGHSADKL